MPARGGIGGPKPRRGPNGHPFHETAARLFIQAMRERRGWAEAIRISGLDEATIRQWLTEGKSDRPDREGQREFYEGFASFLETAYEAADRFLGRTRKKKAKVNL